MNALKNRDYTVEEYFSILEESDTKLEYHNGKIYAMAGGTFNHSVLSMNMGTALNNALSEKDCVVCSSDQQVFIQSENRYVFPEVSVVCGEGEFDDKKNTRLKNPVLIVESIVRRYDGL